MSKTCRTCGHLDWVHSQNNSTRCQGWWACNIKHGELDEPEHGYYWSAEPFAECYCHKSYYDVTQHGVYTK